MRNSFRSLLLLAVVLTACSDQDPFDPGASLRVTGSYTLQTINGQLPYPLISFAGVYELIQTGGSLTVSDDSTYTERAILRELLNDDQGVPQARDTTVVIRGRWEQEDSAIVLLPNNSSSPLIGLIGNDRLTLNFEAANDSLITYVYVRGLGGAARPLAFHGSSTSSVSTIRLRTTTSSMIGLRSMMTSSEASLRASIVRTSSIRSSR